MKQIKSQSTTLIKKYDECGKAFNLNDGNAHYYDAQLDIYLCSDRCLYDSFFEQVGDITVDYVLHHPEYNVVKFNGKKAVVA